MVQKFSIKRKDTKPYLAVQFKSITGSVIDLNGRSVYFNLATADGAYTPIFSGLSVITDASNGICQYEWTSGNTNRSGTYLGEFEIISGTEVYTFPSNHGLYINIYEDYDN